MDAAIVTAFADNAIGRLIQDLIYQGGVDQSLIRWVDYDGVGRVIYACHRAGITKIGFIIEPPVRGG